MKLFFNRQNTKKGKKERRKDWDFHLPKDQGLSKKIQIIIIIA